jgi:hypothetical protein
MSKINFNKTENNLQIAFTQVGVIKADIFNNHDSGFS